MLEIDKQAAFNAAYIGVTKQGKASYKYGGSDLKTGGVFEIAPGCRCSLGHVAHDLYGIRWYFNDHGECCTMDEPIEHLNGTRELMDNPFGKQLMKAHDSAAKFTGENNNLGFIAAFQARMQAIALEHNLTVPEVA